MPGYLVMSPVSLDLVELPVIKGTLNKCYNCQLISIYETIRGSEHILVYPINNQSVQKADDLKITDWVINQRYIKKNKNKRWQLT